MSKIERARAEMRHGLAQNLKKLLTTHEIAPIQLAEKCGVGRDVISRILSGASKNPHVETLKPLAEFFGVTIDQLIGSSPLPNEHTYGVIVPMNRLLVPIIAWENIPFWHLIKDSFKVTSTIAVNTKISPSSFALYIKDSKFVPRFSEDTTIVIDPTVEPKNRDYVIVDDSEKSDSSIYGGLTIKQIIFDEDKRFLKNIGGDFDMNPLKKRQKIHGVIMEAFLQMHSER